LLDLNHLDFWRTRLRLLGFPTADRTQQNHARNDLPETWTAFHRPVDWTKFNNEPLITAFHAHANPRHLFINHSIVANNF
jgi:hypothetical protein